MKSQISKACVCSLTILVCILGALSAAQAHPYENCDLFSWPPNYGVPGSGFGPEYEVTGVTFHGQMPNPDTLGPAEQYMICGGKDRTTGMALRPWVNEILMHVSAYFELEHRIPETLGPAEFEILSGGQSTYGEKTLNRVRNPITGAFPRLDAVDFSPGDIFIRDLTMAEMRRLAEVNSTYQDVWFDGEWLSPEGEVETTELSSPVLYVRAYGQTGVIYESIYFEWQETQ